MTALLATEGLTRRYGSLLALDGLDFTVAPGARHAIIGPNGAGKTTLLNLVAGADRPTAGRIRLDGVDITAMRAARRAQRGIGRTHQHPAVWPSLSTLDNVRVAARRPWGRVRGRGELVRCLHLLDAAGLGGSASTLAGALSHGQRRQLELAMALAGHPRLLLLDEPAAGLAPSEVDTLAKILTQLPRSVAVVLVEHHLDLVYAFAGAVTVLHAGRHVATGSPDDIRRSPEVAAVYAGVRGGT